MELRVGEDWRVGWRNDQFYAALVGAEDWATELTAAEFKAFVDLFRQLHGQLLAIAPELMAEEMITLSGGNDAVHLELEGYPHAYSLHLIVLGDRRVEGTWPAPVPPDFLLACCELQHRIAEGQSLE
ncbi:DUF1818 family protein [Thermosynechococcus sp. GLH187]|uniref:DUF1818 family protein n=1 Tax=unclassified Thermosynechococcus TaxID=2622553 RepID=UPI00287776A2|nr:MULTISPECIES: DUF1818 family protein [unclassified Thermosynechococcus]WNC45836.1 DUF1818 family protein [Thermosynechococcus sp. GLH187]WNC48372.1 DUF1818 family protein [Thermosynechococcus sp. GLH333]WNC50905.1 DUF1818 family protein [Thermosynechococcus sp. GLH87]